MNGSIKVQFNVSGLDDVTRTIANVKDSIRQLEEDVSKVYEAIGRVGFEANQLAGNPPADQESYGSNETEILASSGMTLTEISATDNPFDKSDKENPL